jgi:hypothetical protein
MGIRTELRTDRAVGMERPRGRSRSAHVRIRSIVTALWLSLSGLGARPWTGEALLLRNGTAASAPVSTCSLVLMRAGSQVS